jgi:hypothetical protein
MTHVVACEIVRFKENQKMKYLYYVLLSVVIFTTKANAQGLNLFDPSYICDFKQVIETGLEDGKTFKDVIGSNWQIAVFNDAHQAVLVTRSFSKNALEGFGPVSVGKIFFNVANRSSAGPSDLFISKGNDSTVSLNLTSGELRLRIKSMDGFSTVMADGKCYRVQDQESVGTHN